MNELRIELVEGRSTFAPGEELRVRASWRLDPPPEIHWANGSVRATRPERCVGHQ